MAISIDPDADFSREFRTWAPSRPTKTQYQAALDALDPQGAFFDTFDSVGNWFADKGLKLAFSAAGGFDIDSAGNEVGYDERSSDEPINSEVNVDDFGDMDFSDFEMGVSSDMGSIVDDFGGGGIDWSGGDVVLGGSGGGYPMVTRTMGAVPMMGAAAGAVIGLGTKLARMFAGRGATFVINGVRGKLADLWPYARKYGPTALASAMGIGAAELAQLLASAPPGGARRRRRGISAADITRAKRVIRFNRRLTQQLGTGRSGGRSYRPRARRRYAYC